MTKKSKASKLVLSDEELEMMESVKFELIDSEFDDIDPPFIVSSFVGGGKFMFA
jgi:hypothetical protein